MLINMIRYEVKDWALTGVYTKILMYDEIIVLFTCIGCEKIFAGLLTRSDLMFYTIQEESHENV